MMIVMLGETREDITEEEEDQCLVAAVMLVMTETSLVETGRRGGSTSRMLRERQERLIALASHTGPSKEDLARWRDEYRENVIEKKVKIVNSITTCKLEA